ncbi:penicillin-binding protein [Phycicoccus sp. SLBN-51]|uniref:transglycosylase domain-containing protein n=1 Tax=Phycicoccus sp. SLBN-51 TaxID=2768447 RepID=UPI0011516B9E|nr:penicillin-binding protein [Phycicoccus sp. SLBN-51]TQJ49231.1 membrane peptidoglycan carboxypeptidase [Phycicoccus sp. SLBN-51]
MQGRASNFANVLSLLGAFVATAMVMGLLAAGLVIPAVGATGSAAKSGVQAFDSLPGEFTTSPLAQQSKIYDARGGLITTPYDENRIIVPLKAISKTMQNAQIAIEDSRFREHGGVDPRGITRALVSNFKGGDTQGASTLTQQYVKITLQENALRNNDKAAAQAATAKTYTRKLQELKYAITLEKQLTKDQILEGYLNLVYYGDQAYGVEAAAQHYFSTSAAKLSLSQSALLAGLVQQPSRTDPIHNPERAQVRRNVVLDRMHELGMVTDKEWKAAKAVPVKKMLKVKPAQNTCGRSTQPYFCEYILAYLKQLPALGKSVPERIKKINQGGLTIQTTLDPKVQAMAQEQVEKKVPVGNSERIGAAASIIEPGTGKVLAMVQASRFPTTGQKGKKYTQVNWNVDQKYGGTSGAQFGSTAKMYAIVTALENGIPVNGTIPSKFATPKQAAIYTPSEMRGKCGAGSAWPVRNDEAIGGKPLPFSLATQKSVNTAFASLVLKLGTNKVHDTMNKMGLHQGTGKEIECFPAAVTLGANDTTPLTLASSYATLAAEGKYCTPNPILSITTNDKKPIKLPTDNCKQVISKDVANGATKLLEGVIQKGTGVQAKLAGGRPAAGKTGTTDNHVESWFVGYTPQLASAVWVGTPYSQKRMKNIRLGNDFYPEVFGGTISAPIWKQLMDGASQILDKPKRDFDEASGKVLEGDVISIPSVSGMSVQDATKALEDAGFKAQVAGNTYSNMSSGTVVYTNPSGRAVRGTTVGLYVSTGYVPAPPKPKATSTPKPSKTTTTTKPKTTKTPPPKKKSATSTAPSG